MLTIKVIREDKIGRQRTHIYEAVSASIFPEGGTGIDHPYVVLNQLNGEQPWIHVGDWDSEFPCIAVYVENEIGKTIDALRANRDLKSVDCE